MDLLIFKSFVAGLLLGFPAGPIGALAIRTMISKGSIHGVFFGFGCGLVDVIYAGVIGIGIKHLSVFFTSYQYWINLLGGFILLVIGLKIFFTNPSINIVSKHSWKGLLGSFLLAFLLALSSPATFLSFSAVFSSFDLGFSSIFSHDGIKTIAGVVTGGAVWWVILGFGIKHYHGIINTRIMKYANKAFGTIIICLAVLINI